MGDPPNLTLANHSIHSLANQNKIYQRQKRHATNLNNNNSSGILKISNAKWKLFYCRQWYYKVLSIYILNSTNFDHKGTP